MKSSVRPLVVAFSLSRVVQDVRTRNESERACVPPRYRDRPRNDQSPEERE